MTILNPAPIIQGIRVQFSGCLFRFIIIILLYYGGSLSVLAATANYNTGAFYFANGDYNTAMQIWAPLAQAGNPAAQYSIGLLYDQGKGVKKDPQTALKYFQAAIKQNLPAAQYYLGVKYYAGLGIKKNPGKAIDLVHRAAKQDHLQAQFQLAYFYDQGIGTPKDPVKATQWYSRAAENGFGPAQHALAARYLTGRGASLDLKQGVFWLQKAAEQNDSDAMRDLGFLYYQGMGVKKDWAQARTLLLDPAEEGSALAQYVLGELYTQGGYGITADKKKARYWLRKAQQSGSKEATQRLKQLSNSKHTDPAIKPANPPLSAKKTVPSVKSGHNPAPSSHSVPAQSSKNTQIPENSLDNNRFKELEDNDYTVQILQARHYQSIQKIIDRFRNQQTYVLKIKRSNQLFYVLTYGSYTDYGLARQAAGQLPEALNLKSRPWIRKTGSLKKLLQSF